MFERDHDEPLGFQLRVRPALAALLAAVRRHQHLTCRTRRRTPGPRRPCYAARRGSDAAPRAAAGQAGRHVLVRVTAAPVTPLDLLCASGTSYFGPPDLPYVPGVQGVGVVEEGDGWRPAPPSGSAPTPGCGPGTAASPRSPPCRRATSCRCRHGADDVAAAALGLSAVAAWMALTWRGGLRGRRAGARPRRGRRRRPGRRAGRRRARRGRVVAAARRRGRPRPGAAARRRRRGRPRAAPTSTCSTARLREACGGPVDLVIDPVCGAAGDRRPARARPTRPAGQPRLRRRAHGDVRLGRAAQRLAQHPRLHEQLADPRQPGRGPDPGAARSPPPAAAPSTHQTVALDDVDGRVAACRAAVRRAGRRAAPTDRAQVRSRPVPPECRRVADDRTSAVPDHAGRAATRSRTG